eukprot:1404516-Rhodomonas_salina.2
MACAGAGESRAGWLLVPYHHVIHDSIASVHFTIALATTTRLVRIRRTKQVQCESLSATTTGRFQVVAVLLVLQPRDGHSDTLVMLAESLYGVPRLGS